MTQPAGTQVGSAYVTVSAHLNKNGATQLQHQLQGTISKAMLGVNNRLGVQLGPQAARASNQLLTAVGKNLQAGMAAQGTAAGAKFGQGFTKQIAAHSAKSGGHMSSFFHRASKDAARFFSDLGTRVGIASFQMQMFGQSLTLATTLPAAAGIGLFAKTGLSFAAQVDTATAGLKAMLPAGYNVEALLKRLNTLAVKSAAFNAADVITYTQKLTAAGNPIKSTEKLMASLSNIFGTFGVTGENASLAMLGISQIFQKGKVQGEELTKQISQQIPIWKLLSEGMGVTQAKLTEMVSEGKVSAEDFQKAMVKIGNTKKFLKGADNAVNTLGGAWQMFKEKLTVNIGMAFLENKGPILKSLHNFEDALTPLVNWMVEKLPMAIDLLTRFTEKIKNLMAEFQKMTPEQQDRIMKFVGALVALGPALIALSKGGTLVSFVGQLLATVTGLVAMGAMTAGVGIALSALVVGLGLAAVALGVFLVKTKEGREMWEGFKEGFTKGWNENVVPAFERLKEAWNQLKPALEDLLISFGFTSWRDFGTWLGTTLTASIGAVIDKFTGFMNIVRETASAIAAMKRAWDDLMGNVGPGRDPSGTLGFEGLRQSRPHQDPNFGALKQNKPRGYATGGRIGGYGGSTADRNLIRASPGEWMIPAGAAAAIGPAGMEMIRNGNVPVVAASALGGGGGGGTITVEVIIDGVAQMVDVKMADNNRKIANVIARGRK